MIDKIVSEIVSNAPEVFPVFRQEFIQKVLQTQPGGYGFGDKFSGTKIPILRKIAKRFGTFVAKPTARSKVCSSCDSNKTLQKASRRGI